MCERTHINEHAYIDNTYDLPPTIQQPILIFRVLLSIHLSKLSRQSLVTKLSITKKVLVI